jgi:acetylornithine/succinyldiaminopimelate/putrescine aminotransferase
LEIIDRDNVLDHGRSLADLAQEVMSDWTERFQIVSEVRGLGLLIGVSFEVDDYDGVHVARTVRDEMLKRGVWALCDFQPQVRLYPALNMAPDVFRSGLEAMAEAIAAVEQSGPQVGDYPARPSGNVGF